MSAPRTRARARRDSTARRTSSIIEMTAQKVPNATANNNFRLSKMVEKTPPGFFVCTASSPSMIGLWSAAAAAVAASEAGPAAAPPGPGVEVGEGETAAAPPPVASADVAASVCNAVGATVARVVGASVVNCKLVGCKVVRLSVVGCIVDGNVGCKVVGLTVVGCKVD